MKLEDAYWKAKEKYCSQKFELIKDDHFLEIQNYLVTLANGDVIHRSKLMKNRQEGNAIVVIALTENQQLILTIQPRPFTQETVEISFPAGLIDKDEDALSTARRELLEEVGATASSFELLGCVYQDEAISAAKIYYYLAYDCQQVEEQHLDSEEFIDIVTVELEEVFHFLSTLQIVPSTFLTGLLLLKQKIGK